MPVGRSAAAAAIAAAVVLAYTGAAAPAAPNGRGVAETVTVADDYFAPEAVKIKRGQKVKWSWDELNTDTHDVKLTDEHPKGVKPKDFHSSSGALGIKFARKFEKPGKYGFVCTFHRSVMRMTVTVKKH